MKIWTMWMISFMLLTIFLLIVKTAQKNLLLEKENWSQFECGFNTMNPSHIPFSFQFFLIALLFLIFDVEIALLLSYPMEIKVNKNVIMIFFFIMLLTLGLLYEWQKGKTKWTN